MFGNMKGTHYNGFAVVTGTLCRHEPLGQYFADARYNDFILKSLQQAHNADTGRQVQYFVDTRFNDLPFRVIKPILIKQCPVCGHKFEDFRETGFLGCSKCYDYFREELTPYIIDLAGGAE